MTHDLRKKARAVFLATLMVVSVFGGTMAFAGTAAAQNTQVPATISASPAEVDTAGDHVVLFEVDQLSSGETLGATSGGTEDSINISSASGVTYSATSSEVTVETIQSGGTVSNTLTDADLNVDTASGSTLEVSLDSDGNDVDDSGIDLTSQKYVRVTIDPAGIAHSGVNDPTVDLDIDLTDNNGDSVISGSDTLEVGSSAPIQVNDTSSTAVDTNTSSMEDALGNQITSNTDFINISGDVNELRTAPRSVDSDPGATQPGQSDFTIQSVGGSQQTVTVLNDGTARTSAIDFQANNDITVDNVQFNSSSEVNVAVSEAITSGDVAKRLNITNSAFNSFTASGTNGVLDLAQADDLNVSANTFDGSGYSAIQINDVDSDSDVNDNTIRNIDAKEGIDVDDGADEATINVSRNTISGITSGTGVAVTSSGSGDVVNAKNNDLTLSGAGTAIDIDGTPAQDSEFNINGTVVSGDATSDDDAVSVKGGDGAIVRVAGSNTDIQDTREGVVVSSTSSNTLDLKVLDSATINVTEDGGTARVVEVDQPANNVDVVVNNANLESDGAATGLHVDDDGDGSVTLTLDEQDGDASTFKKLDLGVDLEAASVTGNQITNTTFTDISTTALNQQANVGADLTLADITVDGNSAGATAVVFKDGGNNALTVKNSSLGVSSTEEVNDGVDVQSRAGEIVVNSTDIHVDGGNAINIASDDASALTIDGTTVFGSDQTGTGIRVDDASLNGLNINPDNAGTIQNVDTGIDIQDTAGARTLGSGVDIDNFGTAGIVDASNRDLTLSGVSLTEADGAGATGVQASGSGAVTINSQSTIEVADDSGSAGVLVNTGGNVDIQKSTITAKDTRSDGTAIDLDSITTTVTIKLNNIAGFNTSSGLGLDATDASTSLEDDEVEGNYWGSEYGPDANAGSNISSGVAAEVYDPFLTADLATQVENAEDADSVSALTESDVQEFAHGLTVGEGESFAFPATSTDTQISDIYTDNSSNVAIYEYNASSQSWELASGRPTGLDAYVASFGDNGDSINVKIEYESQSSGVDRGTYEYQEGFNYLPVAQENAVVGTSVIGATSGFDLAGPSNSATRFASQYSGAANDIYSHTSYATVSGNNLGGPGPSPDISPFQGTFVYVDTSVDDNQIAPLDPSVSLANAGDIDA